MEAFISGQWRTPTRGEVYIGGTWRRLSRIEVYINGAWRSAAKFIQPLTLRVSPNPVLGSGGGPKPLSRIVSSEAASALPTGGLAPYQYSWAVTSGNVTVRSPTMSSTDFYATLGPNEYRVANATVTCTDALGSVANATLRIELSNFAEV